MSARVLSSVLAFTLGLGPAHAIDARIDQVSPHMGEMVVTMGSGQRPVDDTLRFEPYQMVDDLFLRDDYVLVMRHGPTDWSKLDEENVAPGDCANQRVLSESGQDAMRNLGTLMAANGLYPAQIVVSEWCRNQQTVEHLLRGMEVVDASVRERIPLETDAELNLLLSLQGAADVTGLRERVETWTGSNGAGPLLLITHFTNIEELTTFTVFEGEMLMVDPQRDGRVLGYLRLQSARPDIGHFNVR